MITPYQKSHNVFLRAPITGFSSFFVPPEGGGTIKRLVIWGVVSVNSAKFNLRINGDPVFSGGSRPELTTSASFVVIDDLDIEVEFGDVVSIDLEVRPTGGVNLPIAWQVDIDDGVSSGGATDLEGLTDVDLTTPVTDDIMKHNGTLFVNVPHTLDNVKDVVITSPATGAILKFNGTDWIDDTNNLDGLSDVVISTPMTNQVLKYNGTNWINDTDATGGGSTLGIFNPDIPYASPSTEDDEFNAGSLNAKWTAIAGVTAPTLNWDIPNHIGGSRGASGQLCGYYQSKTGSITIRAKVANVQAAVNQSVGIFMRESGPHFTSLRVDNSNVIVEEFINATSVYLQKFNQAITAPSYLVPDVYLEMKYNGTSIESSISVNGKDFTLIHTNATAFPFGGTMDGFGICWLGGASAPTKPARIDWFRVLQGNYTGMNI